MVFEPGPLGSKMGRRCGIAAFFPGTTGAVRVIGAPGCSSRCGLPGTLCRLQTVLDEPSDGGPPAGEGSPVAFTLLQLVYDGSSGMGVHRQLGTALTQYSRCRVFTNGHRSSVPDYLGGWSTGRCGQPVYQRMMMTATGARRARCWNQSRSPAKVTVRQQRPHRRKLMWPVQPGRWRWTRWSLQWRLGQKLKPRNLFLGEDAQI